MNQTGAQKSPVGRDGERGYLETMHNKIRIETPRNEGKAQFPVGFAQLAAVTSNPAELSVTHRFVVGSQ